MVCTKDKKIKYPWLHLTEVIVTIVILGILLGTTITGLITWQHRAMYKKNNEYAQIIFNAAQSALSHREAGGNLEELEKYVKSGRTAAARLRITVFPIRGIFIILILQWMKLLMKSY